MWYGRYLGQARGVSRPGVAAALLCVLCVGEFLLLCCGVVFHLLPLLSGLFELIEDGDGSSLLCAPRCVNLEFPPDSVANFFFFVS